jgi:proton-dependent oligopeptide transporter, POT family
MSVFENLRKIPREAWLLVLLRPFTMFGYFATRVVLVLYLSQEHGYDDNGAAAMYAWCGFAAVLAGLFTGPLVDRLGVRRSIVIGSIISFAGTMTLAGSYDRTSMSIALFLVLPIGLGLSVPAYNIGGKVYSFAGTQSLIFALLYFTMNVGASVAGSVYDAFRSKWPDGTAHYYEYETSNERLLIILAACAALAPVFVAGPFLRDVRVGDEGTVYVGAPLENPIEELGAAIDNVDFSVQARKSFYERYFAWYWLNVFTVIRFWRLVTFTVSLVFVSQVYQQFDATLPKFALRVLGPQAPIGSFYAINPIVIMSLFWLSPALLRYVDPYLLQIIGSFVSAVSLFIIAMVPTTSGIAVALIAFSVGEAIYSPNTAAITMSMSPAGHEGTYGNLASLPLFFSTLAVGYSSGPLLTNFCPRAVVGEITATFAANQTSEAAVWRSVPQQEALESCAYIWTVVAAVALATPVLLVLLNRFIYSPDIKASVRLRANRFKTDAIDGIET